MTEPDGDPTRDDPAGGSDPDGSDTGASTNDGPTDDDLARAPRGRSRRAPRYVPFVSTGALAGVLVAVVLILVLPPVEQLGTRQALGYLALVLGLVGGLVGAAVAVVLDRRA